jgi:hypothetical protein
MKRSISIAICLGVVAGFLACTVAGRQAAQKNAFRKFVRLNPYLEQETSYYPTASQFAATARAQCPPGSNKTLVVIGGNSIFNGSGQKGPALWSRVLQGELGDGYHVINFSAPGAGPADTGGVVFQMLAREYPRMLFVTNTEPGYYAPPESSAYAYLFWDAYCKGALPEDPARAARLARGIEAGKWLDYRLGRGMNALFHFNDLWTGVAYERVSTVWTSWLKGRSFQARRRLPDWHDKRPVIQPTDQWFEGLLPGHLEALRRRRSVAPERFQQGSDGSWMQTEESLRREKEEIAALVPRPLEQRTIVVFTPINPWFLSRLTNDERSRVEASYRHGVMLMEEAGFNAMSLFDQGFQPGDFGDTVHLSPSGGKRLAHLVAASVRQLAQEQKVAPAP